MNEEDQEAISESLDFSKPDYEFKPGDYHEWHQRGPYCVCTSCEIEHAIYIGMDKLLVGLDEKGPILKKR